MSKVSEEQYTKDLEHDVDTLATMVLDLRKENEKLIDIVTGLIGAVPETKVELETNQLELFDE